MPPPRCRLEVVTKRQIAAQAVADAADAQLLSRFYEERLALRQIGIGALPDHDAALMKTEAWPHDAYPGKAGSAGSADASGSALALVVRRVFGFISSGAA